MVGNSNNSIDLIKIWEALIGESTQQMNNESSTKGQLP